MNLVNGKTVLEHTIERAKEYGDIAIIAPEFDQGNLDHLPYRLVYSHDDSPLKRLVAITREMDDDTRIVRVDGLHMCADFESAREWYERGYPYDVVKLFDDIPPQLGCDVYRVGGLRKLLASNPAPEFHVHPKFAMKTYRIWPNIEDSDLRHARDIGKQIYAAPRLEVGDTGINAGDQLRFHYELAKQWVHGQTLDIACGGGFGCEMLKASATQMWGADIDPTALPQGDQSKAWGYICYVCDDVTDMSFHDGVFDCVTSMETFEHVDPDKFLSEIKRVLKAGGTFVMSTPQNCMGHIPLNAQHIREYSLEELTEKVGEYFDIQETIGIKAGRIVIPGDPIGNNTVLRCAKS